jgi:DNA processing protein
MDTLELACTLSLLALPMAGPASLSRLLSTAGSAAAALELPDELLQPLGLRPETVVALRALRGRPSDEAVRQRDWLEANGIAVIDLGHPGYPPLLARIQRPPPLLFVRGSAALLTSPQLAIVGSRRPTPSGRELAAELALGLSTYGLTITSGLANGIDAAAHGGAIHGSGRSIAVMGTGPDRIYPRANLRLAEELLATGGALLTEFPPGVRPDAPNFPRRNRVISGLSLGVLVVEAALPSGSLSTAQHALDQDREVMAVPGPVRSATSRGCHELLRNGAALVECPEDVIRALGDRFSPAVTPGPPAPVAAPASPSDPDQCRVLAALGPDAVSVDHIALRSGLAVARIATALVGLELAGHVEAVPGGYARCR